MQRLCKILRSANWQELDLEASYWSYCFEDQQNSRYPCKDKTLCTFKYPSSIQIYRSLIYPYTLYGTPVWGQAVQCDLEKILILQKRALRLIFFSNNRTHAIPLFIASNILPVLKYALFWNGFRHNARSVSTNYTPWNIRQLFIHSSDVHAHNKRSSSTKNFFIQESRLRVKLKSFSTFGSRLWTVYTPTGVN